MISGEEEVGKQLKLSKPEITRPSCIYFPGFLKVQNKLVSKIDLVYLPEKVLKKLTFSGTISRLSSSALKNQQKFMQEHLHHLHFYLM